MVFYAAATPQPWGQYIEAPTKNIASNQFWCNNTTTDIPGAQGTAFGAGKQNTVDMDAACTSGAGQAAADFVYGAKDDWYLPAKDELNAMYQQRTLLKMAGYYFSSSEAKPLFAWDQYMGDGTPYPQGKNNGREVRPVRAFGPTNTITSGNAAPQSLTTAAPIVKPITPTTMRPVLTTQATSLNTIKRLPTPTTAAKQSSTEK